MVKKTSNSVNNDRVRQFETLEDRLVLSAQGIADLPVPSTEATDVPAVVASDDVAITNQAVTLTEVNQSTGVNHVHDNYGFDGQGQTVVVIDSGIAWDHYALGGGYGEGHRVVGGWDFAENDADPFDDGGAGYHGTHVSGIIGSSDDVHKGVASGVDLVSLRVFDDAGNGNLEWVEQALQWVEQNIDSFENPITTVNLSIGTNWNANNLPEWATLEEEFAALESRGIFISVAAGNSFQSDPTAGVSYPAVSEHVVPVASHGEDGQLSDFSQRNQNVLVAPGEEIMSTIPGHLLGQSVSQSFLGSSGTSMAAPYVAGSSVLIRQAMDFMGYQDVTQDQIYDNLRATADTIFDNITGASYKKINMQAAIEAIITDQYGDSASNATDIGSLNGGETLKGVIGTFSDKDVIQFTAGQSGVMTFEVDQTHQLDLLIKALGQDATVDGNKISFQVQEGETYQIQLSTQSGIGHYSIATSIETFVAPAMDIGKVDHFQNQNLVLGSESSYNFEAGKSGILVIQFVPGSGSVQPDISIYDSGNNLVGKAQFDGQKYVFQTTVTEGESFTVRAQGQGEGKLDVQNLVSHQSGSLNIHGTNGDNVLSVTDGDQLKVVVDGVEYQFQRTEVTKIGLDAGSGNDQLSFQSSEGTINTAWMKSYAFYTSGSGFQLSAFNFQSTDFVGQAEDVINLYGGSGVDEFFFDTNTTRFSGEGFTNTSTGTGRVYVTGSAEDRAVILGSEGSDYLYSAHDLTYLSGGGSILAARGFAQLQFDLGDGDDSAHLIGSWGDDHVVANYDSVTIQSDGMDRSFKGIEKRYIFGNGGSDSATFYGSNEHADSLYAWHDSAYMKSGDVINYVRDFESFTAYGDSQDRAVLFDSAGDDQFIAGRNSASMIGDGFHNTVNGFGQVDAYSSTGSDTARFVYSDNETFQDNGSLAAISGDGFHRIAHGFDSVVQDYQNSQTQSQTNSLSTLADAEVAVESELITGHQLGQNGGAAGDAIFESLGQTWSESDRLNEESEEDEGSSGLLNAQEQELLATDWYFGHADEQDS